INRVILPVAKEEDPHTSSAKQCSSCGYLHPFLGPAGPDLCTWCGSPLPTPFRYLFRMRNVSTKRREKINSDEEERQRMGFELKTGFHFARRGGELSSRKADVTDASAQALAELHYGAAATLWRINLGWTRRSNKGNLGFVLDLERGYWA